jgi:hypothetical protein
LHSQGAGPHAILISPTRSGETIQGFTLQYIDKSKNEEADMLAKAVARGDLITSEVFFHTIAIPVVRNRRPQNHRRYRRPKNCKPNNDIGLKSIPNHVHLGPLSPHRSARGQKVEAPKP